MKYFRFFTKNYLLIIILFLAAVLRIYHIDFQSIWLDEIHTLIETNPEMSFTQFKELILFREGMGHFYFLIIRTLNDVFIYSTYTARMFSAVVGIASIYYFYKLGKTVFNKEVGLIAATLLCVNSFAIYYSQEARPYILLMFFTIVSFERLIIFIKNQSIKNAIIYGLITGLVFNAHTVGLIVVFSQYILLLFLFILISKENKVSFFKNGLIIFITALIVSIPMFQMLKKMTGYKSGWLQNPGPDGFSMIFRQFLGNTELLYFIFTLIIIYYLFNVFKTKCKLNYDELISNKLIFSALILFSWFFIPILLPIIKSYVSEPMILHRYFITLVPALLLTISIGMNLIKTTLVKGLLIIIIVSFALVDIVFVKDYYNKITKTDFREITNTILKRNINKDKVVSSFGWLMSYFLNQDRTNRPTIELPLEAFVNSMRTNEIPLESFWYLDGNYRPYSLTPEDEQFLNEHFIVDASIECYDTWTKHYKLKEEFVSQTLSIDDFGIKYFSPFLKDSSGNMIFFENGEVISNQLNLEKGNYSLVINGNSMPEKPIDGENAHLVIKINEKIIGELNLSENKTNQENKINFKLESNQQIKFHLLFDNDLSKDGQDRNVVIYNIKLKKTN
jgi:4-amino-4-deoxy-L-arabinose transferase-like glycosyltransferase